MTIQELHTQLVARKLRSYYLFTGEEIGIMNIYINQISKLSGKTIVRMDTFAEMYNTVRSRSSKSMFTPQHYTYVIRDDKDVLENEKVMDLLENSNWDDVIVLLFTNLDKRTRFYKQVKEELVEFNHLETPQLKKYVMKEINLNDTNCERLIQVCENDYSRILLEVDKINQFDHENPNSAFEHLLKSGTIYQPPKDAIFDWCETVMSIKPKLAFDLYDQCMRVGEATLPMLTVLYNNVKQTYQVQSCNSKDIGKSTGLTGWQITCGKKFSGKYTDKELLYYMKLLREMEVGIKTGKVDEDIVIPFIMVTMLGGY